LQRDAGASRRGEHGLNDVLAQRRFTSLRGSTGWHYHDGVDSVPLVLLIVYIKPAAIPLSVDVPDPGGGFT
jgi:hypothetical protein